MKLCFSCFKKIPLFAGRCPYCLDEDQSVRGRVIFILVLLFALVAVVHYADYKNKKEAALESQLIDVLRETNMVSE